MLHVLHASIDAASIFFVCGPFSMWRFLLVTTAAYAGSPLEPEAHARTPQPDARRLLFARLPSRSAASEEQQVKFASCPEESPLESLGNRPVKWKLHNTARVPLQLVWISFEGKEQKMEKIGPGDVTTIETYEGHAWRARSLQGVLIAQAKASDSPLTLAPCKDMYGDDASTLTPTLAHAAAAAGRRGVKSRWQGGTLLGALAHCNPWRYLSRQTPFTGLHVVCALHEADGHEPDAIAIFADGFWSAEPSAIVPWGVASTVDDLALVVQHALALPRRAAHLQPSAFFDTSGWRLPSLDAIVARRGDATLLYDGGQWLWPPIAVGHEWLVHANGIAVAAAHAHAEAGVTDGEEAERVLLRLVTISLRPAAFEVHGFLRGDEAEHIRATAEPHMFASGIANVDADRGKSMSDVRTSTMTFLKIDGDARLKALARRVQCLSKVSATHMEAVQVLHYLPWQHYQAHHDFFDPECAHTARASHISARGGEAMRHAPCAMSHAPCDSLHAIKWRPTCLATVTMQSCGVQHALRQ